MINVLLVEDQAMVREGLKMMIETAPDIRVRAQATNGREAITQCETHVFDVIVMDIRMPVMDGLEATRYITKRWPERYILILTTFNNDRYAIEALQLGAKGYMLKDGEPELLIRAIRSCLTGGMSLQDEVAAKVLPRLLSSSDQPKPSDNLTPREREILTHIGHGLSNREIAECLALSVGTVKNHISQVLDKLELRDRTQLAIYAIRYGLL
ncbi:response regulator [Aureibacillus halotolerans]|uniref:LuxR family two component transcriptional regulator n=1 Tax=Aureibacillus halotolerans TaxID=1508390 RepID=A0A4R6TUH2_9BACI|nr:response regulator transcription factor [Aureibacillus halotolerans]TDQ36242.1 LuxR family two component transcriptional regulator [Aureibacillus halotolerans]